MGQQHFSFFNSSKGGGVLKSLNLSWISARVSFSGFLSTYTRWIVEVPGVVGLIQNGLGKLCWFNPYDEGDIFLYTIVKKTTWKNKQLENNIDINNKT